MKILIMFSLLVLSSFGHATSMSDIMGGCDVGQDYSSYVECIKDRYSRDGNTPNAASVKAFYANMDQIKEASDRGQITNAQAKSLTYRAFLDTVQAENNRINGENANSQARTQSAIDAFIRNTTIQPAPQAPAPTNTNCWRNGNQIQCRSY